MRRLGFIPTPHHPEARRFGVIAPPNLQPRASVNWHGAMNLVPVDALGNDSCGDCVWAAHLRLAQMRMANAWGSTWQPNATMAVRPYVAVTGYDPVTGDHDDGTPLDKAQAYLAQAGLDLDMQAPDVVLPVSVDPLNVGHLKLACDLYGGIWLALNLPSAWDVDGITRWNVAGDPGGWGPHLVACGRYEWDSTFVVISWGIEIELPVASLLKYALSAGAGLSRNWFDTTGRSPSGLDYDEAIARMQSVA